MKRISPEKEIKYISNVIEKNIYYYNVLQDKGFLAENILSQLRNLVEDVAILINNKENNLLLDTHYDNIHQSIDYLKKYTKYKFIIELYEFLKGTASHYTPSEDGAEKLVSFYFRYICLIKNLLHDEYGINIINNIYDFPIYDDKSMKENYDIICTAVDSMDKESAKFTKGKFYVQKTNTIYSNGNIYYEITLSKATDYINKFERITMYSKIYVPDNYSVNISFIDKQVKLNVGISKIKILKDYRVAIRGCELKNLFKIFGINRRLDEELKEYKNLMLYLRENNTITEILLAKNEDYESITKILTEGAENHIITESFDIIRDYVILGKPGHNIIKYITTKMENIVIRDQLDNSTNFVFPSLYLKMGSGMFDEMPFAMSLLKHNISWFHLIKAIDMNDIDYQLLYRTIKSNVENKNILYTPISQLEYFDDLNQEVEKFNKKLKTLKRSPVETLELEKNYIYIKSYEDNSINIIAQLEKYSKVCDEDIVNAINLYLSINLDNLKISEDKIDILHNILRTNSLAFIYGPAGTGKTKMLEILSESFKSFTKYFISVTRTAVSNLSSRINSSNCKFDTISNFKDNNTNDCEILFIDECSMVSNNDMISILSKQKYRAIVMVGDVFQIESIKYGNWFELCNRYFGPNIRFELKNTHRTTDTDLLSLWNAIRDNDKKAVSILNNQEYTQPLSEKIFEKMSDDEIVLCLNYDGMYGINNINKVRQCANQNKEFNIGVDTYKIEDHILFNDCPRFRNVLYNNLKGIIKDIFQDENKDGWWFTIEIDKDAIDITKLPEDIELIDSVNENKINIKFKVNEYADRNDDENQYDHIIPFNLAYAISIHKAQGLEYDCVKIVITSNVEDKITKNIFYTAITRAKSILQVYWNSDSQTKIFNNFEQYNSNKDIAIIRQKIKSSKENNLDELK